MRAENKVTKQEVKKSIMEINKNETRNVTKGFVCNNADNATTIKMCNTLTEAKEEFKKSNENKYYKKILWQKKFCFCKPIV